LATFVSPVPQEPERPVTARWELAVGRLDMNRPGNVVRSLELASHTPQSEGHLILIVSPFLAVRDHGRDVATDGTHRTFWSDCNQSLLISVRDDVDSHRANHTNRLIDLRCDGIQCEAKSRRVTVLGEFKADGSAILLVEALFGVKPAQVTKEDVDVHVGVPGPRNNVHRIRELAGSPLDWRADDVENGGSDRRWRYRSVTRVNVGHAR